MNRVLDAVCRYTRHHHTDRMSASDFCHRCSHFNIMILFVVTVRAFSLHAPDHIFRYIHPALIQSVSIFHYIEIFVNHHNPSVIDVCQLDQIRIDHF